MGKRDPKSGKPDQGSGRTPSNRNTEKDADDLVHAQETNPPSEIGQEDPDDAVHQPRHTPYSGKESGLEDPDDLVHGQPDDDDLEP